MNFNIDITNEHIQRLRGTTPADALIELIWNSIDAGATKIQFLTHENQMGGIDYITLQDNGDGIDMNNIKLTFGKLGVSQKKSLRTNSRGRGFHGSLGEGRFKAYALGDKIEWVTTTDQQNFHKIEGSFVNAKKFEVNKTNPPKFKKGTLFTAFNGYEEKVKINISDITSKITAIFAPVLITDKGLKISINGKNINPSDSIFRELEEPLTANKCKVKIIIWKHGRNIEGYWCTNGYSVKESFSIDETATTRSFSAFIESPLVEKAVQAGTIGAGELNTDLNNLKIEATEKVSSILAKIDKERAIDTVRNLKESDLYPFKGEPTGEIEKIERKVFDVCVTKVVEAIPNFAKGNKDKQRIAYHLLRTSIESSPSSVQHIFEDILKLPEKEIHELSKILKKYSVAGLIHMTKLVSDRRESIAAIENLVFNSEWKKHVLERKHLHKIIENEAWIFGEEFSIGTSDKALNSVLESHRKLLKIDEETIQYQDEQGNKLSDVIPDLLLGRQYRENAMDHYHHLVIELKRPSVKIGLEEKMQIENYAAEVSSDPRFDKQKTKWTFIAISSEVESKVLDMAAGENGHVSGKGNIKVYVKTWSSVLQSAKGRMQYLWDKAQLEQPDDEGIKYLNEQYSDIFNDIKATKHASISNQKKATAKKKSSKKPSKNKKK